MLMYTFIRIKEKLHSGELAVSGNQWPLFLYQWYNYDPKDPWNGLLKNTLLIFTCVSLPRPFKFTYTLSHDRFTNIFSLHQAQSKKSTRP